MMNNYEILHRKIDEYKLTRKQKALVYKQLTDVVEELEEVIDEQRIEEIIIDIFEFNNIQIEYKRKKKALVGSILGGLYLITIAVLLIFNLTNYINIVSAICLMCWMIYKRHFLLSLCLALYIGSKIFTDIQYLNFPTALLVVILLYFGVKLLLPSTKRKFSFSDGEKDRHYKRRKDFAGSGEDEILFLTNTFGGIDLNFTTEQISYISLDNKFGGAELDFSQFDFNQGDVVLNVENKFGGLTVYVNEQTYVSLLVVSKYGAGTNNSLTNSTKENKIYIQGDNTFGGIEVNIK